MFIELAAVMMLLPDETEEPSERSPPSTAASNLPLAAASIRFCFVGASDLCKWRERENERNGFKTNLVLQSALTGLDPKLGMIFGAVVRITSLFDHNMYVERSRIVANRSRLREI